MNAYYRDKIPLPLQSGADPQFGFMGGAGRASKGIRTEVVQGPTVYGGENAYPSGAFSGPFGHLIAFAV